MTGEEKGVLAAFEEMQQAMIDKNIEKMRELTSPDKTFTHMSGKRQTREEYFREIQNGTLNYYGYRIHHPSVTVNGAYAKLTADVTLKAKVYGIAGSWTLPVKTDYILIQNKWIQTDEKS